MTRPLLAVHDGIDGHRSQTLGLIEALARVTGLPTAEWRVGTAPPTAPRLVVCAGRGASAAAARLARASGCPGVCLMDPGWLARRRFDLLVVPAHDGIQPSERVLLTEGAITPIRPGRRLDAAEALVLIGGPSRHHRWDAAGLAACLERLIARHDGVRFSVTTSRRTPPETTAALAGLAARLADRVAFTPLERSSRAWLEERFDRCGVVWVTQDSVSMIFEARSSGARLGLLAIPLRGRPGRVPRMVASLADRGHAVWCHQHLAGVDLPAPGAPLQEADRISRELLRRLPAVALPSGLGPGGPGPAGPAPAGHASAGLP